MKILGLVCRLICVFFPKFRISAVILPSLQRLQGDLVEWDDSNEENPGTEVIGKARHESSKGFSNVDLEREDECGICLEPCTKMVLPNCCHEMCINCYRDWLVCALEFSQNAYLI